MNSEKIDFHQAMESTDKLLTHVIFDLDGVLLDTEMMYTVAAQEFLEPFGYEFTWSLKEKMMGHTELEAAAILVEELDPPFTPQEFVESRTRILETMYPRAELKPGVDALVRYLAERGVPQAIATSCPRASFELKMTLHQDLLPYFQVIVTGDDPELEHGKPAPDIYLLAARRLRACPSSCLVFEDSLSGVQAGLAAGMRVWAVPDPRLDPETLSGATILASLTEAPHLFANFRIG
ncbi:HAD-IA family hydrolase [bacterium]|nr:HAD-IA family hydrolase [bacterium]